MSSVRRYLAHALYEAPLPTWSEAAAFLVLVAGVLAAYSAA